MMNGYDGSGNKMNNFIYPGEIGKGRVFGSYSGKVLFTATQWQELERQMMIYKYIMASIPVPPQLLIPLSTQSNRGVGMGMDLRFSSGSDPEPWRCRRTDGKKWRCSRDVAPDQKYCERHAHKNKPRSRKHVEVQSHNATITTNTSGLNVTNASLYQQPRCSEWYMTSGSGTISVSPSKQQFEQSTNTHSSSNSHFSSPKVGSKRTNIFPQSFEETNQGDSQFNYCNLQLDSAGARRQHFIDAWSKTGGGDNCSLTLSMQCSGGIDGDDHSFDIESGDVLKSHNQWLNQGSWMGSPPPGGPLGEALGLGIASLGESEPQQSVSDH